MKKLFVLLTVFTFVFYSCSDDSDDIDNSAKGRTERTQEALAPFAGTWIGVYEGEEDNGTATMVISAGGTLVSASNYSVVYDITVETTSILINEDGSFTTRSANGATGTIEFSGNQYTGTWSFPTGAYGGTLSGAKQ